MKKKSDKIILFFQNFESVITIIIAVVISLIIILSTVRVFMELYNILLSDISSPQLIAFKEYQSLFGKIMTLLISIEFLNSVLKSLKLHQVKILVLDVSLITALAIARKLIIYDYSKSDLTSSLILGGLLVSIGIFYFLVKFDRKNKEN